MKLLLMLSIGIAVLAMPCWATDEFKDVPDDHWAKEAVEMVSQSGIMNGYPDETFNGDRHVTRYELSVALAKMVEFIQASQKPIKSSETSPGKHWADNSISMLKCEGFLPTDSPLLQNGQQQITCAELGSALALVSARLIETRMPPVGAPD